jgi:glycerate kinase
VAQILVAPKAFNGTASEPFRHHWRATEVAAAIGRGIERAGLEPPDLCPVTDGGTGTVEILLPALGGETADGYALVGDGSTAISEDRTRLDAAAASGAGTVVYCAGDDDEPPHAPWPHDARLVVLCGPRTPAAAWVSAGARTAPGPAFVLGELGFDERMRAARAVVTGTGVLTTNALLDVVGEVATRARQAGVPADAIVGHDALDLFDRRILDLQHVIEAPDLRDLERAGEQLARLIEHPRPPRRR